MTDEERHAPSSPDAVRDDAAIDAEILAKDPAAAAWLALADRGAGCIDPGAASDLRANARAFGLGSPGALAALARIILGLECDAHDAAAESARRLFEAELARVAANEPAPAFGAHVRDLGAKLIDAGQAGMAARVLARAVTPHDPASWQTAIFLGRALADSGAADPAISLLRDLDAKSEGSAHAFQVRGAFAELLRRVGLYDEAIPLYDFIAEKDPSVDARRSAALAAVACAQSSGDEPGARERLARLLDEAEASSALATPHGAAIVDAMLSLLLVAEDDGAIALQERLVAAMAARVGPAHPWALQERANLVAVLRALGRDDDASRVASELTGLAKEIVVLDRKRRHFPETS